jgi:hypothetical protein
MQGALLAPVITVSLILRHCIWSGREKRNGKCGKVVACRLRHKNFAYRCTSGASSKDFIYCDAGVVWSFARGAHVRG